MTQLKGNYLNGKQDNSNSQNKPKQDSRVLTTEQSKASKSSETDFKSYNFEQSVVLRQSPFWSRAIMMSLVAVASFGIIWASVAKIEQVVPAQGQLKPEGAVKEVQAPVSGVVKAVYVKDGQIVKPGDVLLAFDPTATNAELDSLQKIRASILQENQTYRRLMELNSAEATDVEFLRGNLTKEAASLLKNRAALLAENDLLRTELKNIGERAGVGVDEQQRLAAAKRELDSRAAASQLEIAQAQKRLAQNQVQIGDAKATLDIESRILDKLTPLSKEGAIAQLQYLQQQRTVQNAKAQIAQLAEEEKRLQYDIEQGQEELKNTVAASHKNILDRIADNKKRMAEIDSQITKLILENEKQLADINSKIKQNQMNAKYQELRAPVGGIVFDLQANNPGFVANTSERILSIVPNDKFIAETYITNKDIGFVRKGMKVDIRIDAFPFSEFGDIKGEVESIGSDALPPDQEHPYYRFPARILLDQQYLDVKGRNISLQSGMSVTANIKIREERTVMSLLTDLFTNQVESLKQVR